MADAVKKNKPLSSLWGKLVNVGTHVVADAGFCEVAHMTEVYARIALRSGADAVTVYPYTGWDAIWPFLDAGLTVYIYPPPPILERAFPSIMQRWQQRARRKYGVGRLLIWRPGAVTPQEA